MKRNATKKVAATLFATTLVCSLAPATALARMNTARGSVRAGLTQQLDGFGPQNDTLGGKLAMLNSFGQFQQTNSVAQRLGMFSRQGGNPFDKGNAALAVMGPGTYAFAGGMNGMVRVDAHTGNVTVNARNSSNVGTAPNGAGMNVAPAMGAGTHNTTAPVTGTGAGGRVPGQSGTGNAAQTPTQPSTPGGASQQRGGMSQGNMNQGNMNPGGQQGAVSSASSPTAIVRGTTTNSAAELVADYDNATVLTVTDDNSDIKIKEAGTYIITGAASSGNIVVKKGVTGVVIVLQDLCLTSTSGATLSVNKGAEAKIVVSGNVTLTDAEDPADETSADADVADAFDGAVIKVKAGATACLTGDGTLTVNGSAKNGIKVTGDDEEGYGNLVIDGATISISATNDGINANYDLAILSGNLTVSAGDDAIHADRILTIGDETTLTGPTVNVTRSTEGLEGTVVNICGGDIDVRASDDGINAANGDGAFTDELAYSINMLGGDVTVKAGTDGMDSNGNVNLVGGSATISSANNGGDAGIDYDGQLYVSDEFELNNMSGVAGPDGMGMGGQMGGIPGGVNGQMGNNMGGQMGGMPGGMGGQMGQGGMR